MKTSLFADEMVFHVENPKESTHITYIRLELIREFSKVTGHKVKIKKILLLSNFIILTK